MEEEWKTEKFNECQCAHGMDGGVSKAAEKEPMLAQHEAHVEEKREETLPRETQS